MGYISSLCGFIWALHSLNRVPRTVWGVCNMTGAISWVLVRANGRGVGSLRVSGIWGKGSLGRFLLSFGL